MHQQHVQSTISNADIIIDNDYDAPIESSRAPNREKQTKIKVSADTPIINLLEQQGATLIGHTQQEDHYFTLPDDGNEEIVRIRKQGAHHQFSYKGPLLPDGSKHIYDCKTDPVLLELLEKSYTQQPLIIRKDRAIYQLDGKLLSVDSSIQLGNQILDEILIEVRDADSDMQENILKLLENGDIEHKVFAQMSYVKYAKKIMNI